MDFMDCKKVVVEREGLKPSRRRAASFVDGKDCLFKGTSVNENVKKVNGYEGERRPAG